MRKNKRCLVWILLTSLLCVLVNSSHWIEIKVSDLNRDIPQHSPRLYSLLLWAGNVWINVDEDKLTITNGVVVWFWSSNSVWSNSASIWWWENNNIQSNSHYAWIAWWTFNTIQWWMNSIIWWWNSNIIDWWDAIIAWWENNTGHNWWNILWWNSNVANSGWVVLWGNGNEADINSLALWRASAARWHAFSRNAISEANAARINASNWILIWTSHIVTWVNLVVDWAIKIGGSNSLTWVAWEIKVVNGCFYAFDWLVWHVINRNTADNCNDIPVSKVCKFWNIELQEGDVVTGYNATLSRSCSYAVVTCEDGLLKDSWWSTEYSNPYCYEY